MRVRARTIVRSLAVAAVAASPLAALQADAAINTGAATASGPGISYQNTGGNVTYGTGHSESTVVVGNPPAGAAPLAVPAANALTTAKGAAPAPDPGAAARARALAAVAAARLRAQQQIDAARAAAQAAIDRAMQEANSARARSAQQSQDARAQAQASSSYQR